MVTSFASVLRQVKDDLIGLIPPSMVRSAMAKSAKKFRCRKLPPHKLIAVMLVQAVHGNTAIEHLKHKTAFMKAVTAQGFCKARRRLPREILEALAVELAAKTMNASEADARLALGPGHRVLLIDAFGFRGANCPPLVEVFGRPVGGGSNTAGKPQDQRKPTFPFGHVLAMADHRCGCITGLCVGPGYQHDLHGVEQLHGQMIDGDILVGDTHFSTVMHFSLATANRVHLLVRGKLKKDGKETPLPKQAPADLEVVVESDQRCVARHRGKDPIWMEEPTFAELPRSVERREIVYRLEGSGFRTRRIKLQTTLLDEEAYPALELVKLYLMRWQVEVDFRHLKQTLKAAVLKGRSADVVLKELWSLVLAYNAVCLALSEAARRKKVPPGRVSFIDALRWVQEYLSRRGDPLVALEDLKVNPVNRRWWEPRVLYDCHHKYDHATKPRRAYHDERQATGLPSGPPARRAA